MVSINISNNQGITQAIAQKLKLSRDDCKKVDLGTWQNVLTEINNAESNTQNTNNNDSSIFRKGSNYTTDVNKIGNKSSYHSNFVVDKGSVEIADDVWAKIEELIMDKLETTPAEQSTIAPGARGGAESLVGVGFSEQGSAGEDFSQQYSATQPESTSLTKSKHDESLRNMLGLKDGENIPEGIKLVYIGGEPVIFKDNKPLNEEELNAFKQSIGGSVDNNTNSEVINFDTKSWEANSHVADGGNYSYSEEIIKDEQGRTAIKKVHGLVDVTYSYDYSDDGSCVIKSDYDNSEEIYDTEGRLQRKNYPDGKKGEVAYNDDGSYVVKYTNKDGEYTSSLFYDKDGILVGRQESDKDYETVIHDAKTQTYRIGSQIFDEKQNLCLKDISENPETAFNLIYLDDGKQKFLDADGSYTICNKDGSVVEQYNANKSDKSFVVKYSDDGSYTNTYSDGTYETYNKEGLQIGCSDEDGSWSLTKADSNYFEFNIDDGNVNGQLKISISKDGSVNIAYDGENAELFTGINENAALNDNKVDIKGNLTDQRRLMVDILRLKNECCGLVNSINGETEISGLNGKLDIGSNQGETGDCWLLAGINACKTRPEIKEELEKLIELNNNGGAYVTLKGARDADGNIKPVRYHITSEELNSAKNLSSGDGDERLFEIAMDKYIRDNAYQGISERFDIRGNDPAFFLNTALNMETAAADYKDIAETEDFNNQDKVYTLFSTDDNFTGINAKSSGGESVGLVHNHAYTIKGEDENNMYLINPWAGEDTAENIIAVPKEDLLKSNVNITWGMLA